MIPLWDIKLFVNYFQSILLALNKKSIRSSAGMTRSPSGLVHRESIPLRDSFKVLVHSIHVGRAGFSAAFSAEYLLMQQMERNKCIENSKWANQGVDM